MRISAQSFLKASLPDDVATSRVKLSPGEASGKCTRLLSELALALMEVLSFANVLGDELGSAEFSQA